MGLNSEKAGPSSQPKTFPINYQMNIQPSAPPQRKRKEEPEEEEEGADNSGGGDVRNNDDSSQNPHDSQSPSHDFDDLSKRFGKNSDYFSSACFIVFAPYRSFEETQ